MINLGDNVSMPNVLGGNACHFDKHTISKSSVIGSFQIGTRTRQWLESLRESQWTITSFIPKQRLVCATIISNDGIAIHISLTLPSDVGLNRTGNSDMPTGYCNGTISTNSHLRANQIARACL